MTKKEAVKVIDGRFEIMDYCESAKLEEALDIAIKALEQPEPHWIPCSERLPEKSGKYLVTVMNGNVYAGTFSAYEGKFSCAATAWMPLPPAYKGDE